MTDFDVLALDRGPSAGRDDVVPARPAPRSGGAPEQLPPHVPAGADPRPAGRTRPPALIGGLLAC